MSIESAFICTLSKDPELNQGKNGKPFCNFSCAVADEAYVPQWVNVICFNKTAETLAEGVRKGDRVYCEAV